MAEDTASVAVETNRVCITDNEIEIGDFTLWWCDKVFITCEWSERLTFNEARAVAEWILSKVKES